MVSVETSSNNLLLRRRFSFLNQLSKATGIALEQGQITYYHRNPEAIHPMSRDLLNDLQSGNSSLRPEFDYQLSEIVKARKAGEQVTTPAMFMTRVGNVISCMAREWGYSVSGYTPDLVSSYNTALYNNDTRGAKRIARHIMHDTNPKPDTGTGVLVDRFGGDQTLQNAVLLWLNTLEEDDIAGNPDGIVNSAA